MLASFKQKPAVHIMILVTNNDVLMLRTLVVTKETKHVFFSERYLATTSFMTTAMTRKQ